MNGTYRWRARTVYGENGNRLFPTKWLLKMMDVVVEETSRLSPL